MRERLVFVAAVLLVFSSVTPALAQTAGTIAGTVTDASDAAVPGVTVTARNSETALSTDWTREEDRGARDLSGPAGPPVGFFADTRAVTVLTP